MAMERGGRAAKLGNSYERLWAIRQALAVIQDQSQSLLWEPIGPDEPGVDLWVTQNDGSKTAYQLKRDNGSKGYWSVADLKQARVLQYAKAQLERDDRTRFIFVSSGSARHMCDLAEQSCRADDDPSSFYKHQVCANQDRQKAFYDLMAAWGLDRQKENDRALAFRLLQRMGFEVMNRQDRARKEIELIAGLMFDGEPSNAVGALGDLLEDNLGNELHADQLRTMLVKRSISFRNLAGDPTLAGAIERLQSRFAETISQNLIASTPIGRPEIDELLSKLRNNDPPRLILVHGAAGSGKSVVLQQAYAALRESNMLFLPIQLHIRPPEGSPRQYGATLELPASLAHSLHALAGKRHAVLMLDQLDALRMTSMHSHEAWETCAAVITEALADPRTTVILACRTFDLVNDPNISAWRQAFDERPSNSVAVVKVGDLPEDAVSALLQQHDVQYASLTSRQKRLLRQPATLALWRQLAQAGAAPRSFSSTTELMSKFLLLRREEAVKEHGVTAGDIETALSALVKNMDQRGTLAVHKSLVASHNTATKALCSVGLLHLEGCFISFAHQVYFDYLLAVSVLVEATDGKQDIITWVKSNQTLYRRDQLRHLLVLLRDDDAKRHKTVLRSLILDNDVRFHLKHLVFVLLSQADPPTQYETDLVAELAERDDCWKHALGTIVHSKCAWFDALDKAGHLARWLASWTDENRMCALMVFLRSVLTQWGEEVDRLLTPYFDAGEPWSSRIETVASYDPSDDSPGLSKVRIARIRSGKWQFNDVFLKLIAEKKSERVVPLLEAAILAWIDRLQAYMNSGEGEAPRWMYRDSRLDDEALAAVRANARQAWPIFSHALRVFTVLRRCSKRGLWSSEDFGNHDFALSNSLYSAIRSVELLTNAAAEGLASNHPDVMAAVLNEHSTHTRRGLDHTIAKGLTSGADSLANAAIDWLFDQPTRFHLGDGHDELHWTPAVDVIERFALLCSDESFERLQSLILGYHDDREKRSFHWQREMLQEGRIVRSDWGHAQNHLLSALPTDRMSNKAMERAATWRAKFGDPASERPLASSARSGRVSSPIPPDHLSRINDRHWLRIIAGDWPEQDSRHRSAAHSPFVEATVSHFASDLGTMARREPKRFAALALMIPASSNPNYVTSILRNLVDENPLPNTDSWEPASTEELEAIIEHVGNCRDREYILSVCRLVTARRETRWSDAIINRILSYADHPDPEPGQFSCHSGDGLMGEMSPDIGTSAINCVRGVVAEAITSLFWNRPDATDRLLPTAERLLLDPHVAVRCEALSVCLPLWNHDKDQAVQLLLRSCEHPDDRLLDSHWLQRFIGYALRTHHDSLAPLIERMAQSMIVQVAEHGAAWVTYSHFEQNGLPKLFEECRHGSTHQRKGVATAVTDLFMIEEHSTAAMPILKDAFNDEATDVRNSASGVFSKDDVFSSVNAPQLAESFVQSPAFDDDSNDPLRSLTRYSGDLRLYANAILEAADRHAGAMGASTSAVIPKFPSAANAISILLLRLYDCTERADDQLQNDCLDRWDQILRSHVGMTAEHLKQLDD